MLRVAVLHYVFVTAAVYAVRTGTDVSGNLCTPTTCGIGANCKPGQDDFGNTVAKCTCPRFSIGNPNVVCQKGVCVYSHECPIHLSCDNFLCKDPCAGSSTCADFALCEVKEHEAVCSCPRGYDGDPKETCTYIPSIEAPAPIAVTFAELAYLRNQGFTYWNGRWMIGCTNEQSYVDSLECCRSKNSKIFIPKTREDDLYLEHFRSSNDINLWYPLNDFINEGQFTWADGTRVSKSDEDRIPWWGWAYRVTGFGNRDCGVMDSDGVWIVRCSWIAGIMCTLNKDLLF